MKELELQGQQIISNNVTMAEQNETLTDQHEEIAYRDELLEKKEDRLRELTVKLDDVETLIDEVADAAYEKAVETVTAEVIMETQKQEFAEVDKFREWLQSPDRRIPKKELVIALDYLGKLKTVLIKTTQRVAAAVRRKLLDPMFKKQQKEQIRKEARASVVELLHKTQAEQMARQETPAKEKHHAMNR